MNNEYNELVISKGLKIEGSDKMPIIIQDFIKESDSNLLDLDFEIPHFIDPNICFISLSTKMRHNLDLNDEEKNFLYQIDRSNQLKELIGVGFGQLIDIVEKFKNLFIVAGNTLTNLFKMMEDANTILDSSRDFKKANRVNNFVKNNDTIYKPKVKHIILQNKPRVNQIRNNLR